MSPQPPVDFKLLFERSAAFCLVLDLELTVVAASDSYCRAARIERDAVLGHSIFDVLPGDASRPGADGHANLRASLERVRRLRRPDAMATQRYDVRQTDGGIEEKHGSSVNLPILGDDGRILWIVHRVHDVTPSILDPGTEESSQRLARHQERIIQYLQDANAELAQLDGVRQEQLEMTRQSMLSMLASALAHDVSQPLTAAKNYLGVLRRGRTLPAFDEARTQDMIAKVVGQIDRVGEIVKSLRTLMAAGTIVHRPQNVAAVIAEAAKLSQAAVAASGAVLTVSIDPTLRPASIDRLQIQQLVVDLVNNAAEAVRGCDQRSIRISARAMNGVLLLEVSDTGPGLPREVAERLAEPMAATKLLEFGLGLPISRQIVQEHDGTLSVSPNEPVGTVVLVTLPLD